MIQARAEAAAADVGARGARSLRLFVVVLGAFFFLGLDNYLSRAGHGPVPRYAVLALAAVALLRIGYLGWAARRRVWRLSLAYLTLALFSFLYSELGTEAWQGVEDHLLALIYLTGWLLLLADARACAALERVVVPVVLAAVALNAYELLHPLSLSRVYGRSAGTYVDPNISAGVLAFLAMYVLLRRRRGASRAWIAGLAGAGIVFTFSRGGMLAWAAVLLHHLLGRTRRRIREIAVPMAAATAIVAGAFLLLPEEITRVEDIAYRVSPSLGAGIQDPAGRARLELLKRGLEHFAEQPLLGHGPRAAMHIPLGAEFFGPHNEFLALAINFGVAGVAAWAFYLLRTWKAGLAPASVLLCMISLFTHDLMQMRPLLLGMALVESADYHSRASSASASPCT